MPITGRRFRPSGAGKKQPKPDDDGNIMDGRELMHVMKFWAEQAPEELRAEAMKMWKLKVKAKNKPATITQKRMKRRVSQRTGVTKGRSQRRKRTVEASVIPTRGKFATPHYKTGGTQDSNGHAISGSKESTEGGAIGGGSAGRHRRGVGGGGNPDYEHGNAGHKGQDKNSTHPGVQKLACHACGAVSHFDGG